MGLGSSVYKMVFDTQGLNTLTASRREIALSKQIMLETRPVVEQFGGAFDALNQQLNKDLIGVQDYNRALIALKSDLPENAAALQSVDSAFEHAASVRRSLMTAEDKLAESERNHAAAMAGVQTLLEARIYTEEQAAQARARLAAVTPAVLQSEKRLYDERQRGLSLNQEFTPASEQARNKLVELREAYAAGHVSQSAYQNGVAQLTAQQLTGIPVIGRLASTFATLGPVGTAVEASMMGAAAGLAAVAAATYIVATNVSEQIDKIDKLVASSETIDVPVDQFQRMAHAADYANISQQEFAGGTEKMLVAISKTADGTSKKLIPAFELAGLDAKKLKDMQPGEAFAEITRGLDTIPNAADKARAATAIFGSADFLRIDTSHIDRANSLMDRLRANLDETDANVFSEFDSSVKDMNQAFDVTWQKLAMEIVPALTDAANVATEWLVNLNQHETFTDTLNEIGDSLTIITATSRELPGVYDAWTPSLETFLTSLKSANPKLAIAVEFVETAAGVSSDATSQIAEQARRQRELDAQLREAQDSGKSGLVDDDVSPIEHEVKSIQDLIDKLKEEVATKGMSTAMAKVWKLEQLGAGEEVLQKNRELAKEFDQITKAERAAKAVETFTESLHFQGESSAESARRLADLKLAHEGVDEATRKSLMAQFDASESQKADIETQKKAESEAKKHADAVVTLGENIQKEEANLRGYTSAVGDNEARMRAGERAALEWQLTNEKADVATKAATLSMFDASTALERRAKATKTAIEIQQELTKEIRQTFMTDSEKKLDDAKIAGVGDAELKLIETLQKELHLREEIHKTITATSSVVKAGSREAADAFAEANQIAVRRQFLQAGGVSGMTATVTPPPPLAPEYATHPFQISGVTTSTTQEIPFDPVANALEFERAYTEAFERINKIEGLIEAGNIDLTKRPVVPNDDGSYSTVRSMSFNDKGTEVLIPTVMDSGPKSGQVVSDQEAIDAYRETVRHLGKFDTPQHADVYAEKLHKDQEEAYRPPRSMIAPQNNEQTKLTQKTNEHLAAIREKEPVTITIEEVTL